MPTTEHEGLERELLYVTNDFEAKHIRSLYEGKDPLMHDIAYALITGNDSEVNRLVEQALADDWAANDLLDDGLIAGMAVVGVKFRDNIIFVPEVLISARAMKAGMAHIEPILSASGVEPIGTVIMGTVKGDLHDIGKNLCIMMLRGSGFVVHDLGVDTKNEEFIDAVMEHEAKVLGMSALLTTTMPNMGRVIEAFEEEGMREEVNIMVGGAPGNPRIRRGHGCRRLRRERHRRRRPGKELRDFGLSRNFRHMTSDKTGTAGQRFDRRRYEASLNRLYDIFKGMSDTADEVSQWRCPYKNVESRCTAKFSCRNQHFTNIPDDLPICTGSDKLDYRSAWEV